MNNKNIRIIMILGAMLVLGAIYLFAGRRPPLVVTWRDSYIGIGKVLLVTNISEKTLHHLAISISAPNGQNIEGIVALSLAPSETKSIGWNELGYKGDIWVPEPGDKYKLYCAGYRKPVTGRLPKD